jgi:DNA polymerase delta subunit 1
MYGVTESGHSVLAHIHQFLSYFYVQMTEQVAALYNHKEHEKVLREQLENRLQGAVQAIEVLEKSSVMGFSDKKSKFLKIYVGLPNHVAQLRKTFEENQYRGFLGESVPFETTTFESNMPFALRFMIDNDIAGMQWIQIQKGRYLLRAQQQKTSHC